MKTDAGYESGWSWSGQVILLALLLSFLSPMATSLLFSPFDACCFHRFLLSTRASHDLVSMLHAFMSRLHISLKRSWGAASAPCPQWQARCTVDPWGCLHRPSCEHGPVSVAPGARFRFVNGRCHFSDT